MFTATFANQINCYWCSGNLIFIVLLRNHKQKVKWYIRLIYSPLMFPSVTLRSTQSINKMAFIWLWSRDIAPSDSETRHSFLIVNFCASQNPLNPQTNTLTWISELTFYKNKLGHLRGRGRGDTNKQAYRLWLEIKNKVFILKLMKKIFFYTRFSTWHWLQPDFIKVFYSKDKTP